MRPAAGLGLLLLLPLLPLLELEAAVTPSISPPPPPPQCSAAAVVHGHNYLASTPEIAAVSVGSLAGCCTLAAARPGARFFVYTPGVAPPKCGPAPPTGGGCCHIKGGSLKANDTAAGYISGLLDRPVPPAPPPPPPPQPAPPGAKNVLVLMADDLRPNLGLSYNHSVMRTPALDRLATEALTFTRVCTRTHSSVHEPLHRRPTPKDPGSLHWPCTNRTHCLTSMVTVQPNAINYLYPTTTTTTTTTPPPNRHRPFPRPTWSRRCARLRGTATCQGGGSSRP